MLGHVKSRGIPIPNLENNLDEWKKALKSCKKHSAPGIDGITFAELALLPDSLLERLVRIVAALQEFPDWMMQARTIPLPKVSQYPRACDSRPITIMSTIYRLWAKVATTSILKHLAVNLPVAITGLLPKRGSYEAAYDMQVLLERYIKQSVVANGVTLDLKKCLNLICRPRIKIILVEMGIPQELVNKWFASIQKLVRYWDIAGTVSSFVGSSTGCPEGDSWSVVAMISIANLWVSSVPSQTIAASTTAYADNWAWWTTHFPDHNFILEHTIRTCKILGLEIDWTKTWAWSTNAEGEEALIGLIHQATSQKNSKQRVATDLGCPVVYHGNNVLGNLKTRMQEAKQRLLRVQWASWPIEVKNHVVASSIYPQAFYGSELTVIGIAHLESLRTCIAQALLGSKTPSASSALILQFADPRILDPQIYVILMALKQALRYLGRCNEIQKEFFLQNLATPRKTTGYCQGPASALREYLLRIDLKVAANGNMWVSAFHCVNILKTGYKTLKPLVLQAWQENFLVLQTQRTKLFGLPPIDRVSTLQLLKKYKDSQRLMLLREIAGAFQTRCQQVKWDESTEVQCPWCNAGLDTRSHRLLECSAFAHIREGHEELVQELTDEDSPLVLLPVIFCEADAQYIHSLHQAMPEIEIPRDVTLAIRERHNNQSFFIYTDGSCQAPESVSSRFAAYAIIVDLCTTEEERIFEAQQFLVTGTLPKTLQTVGLARLTGQQGIHRAECMAIVKSFETFPEAIVYSDSSVAGALFNLCQNATKESELLMRNDFDLASRLFHSIAPLSQVRKIKAHRDIATISDPIERYHALGNLKANDEAIRARDELLPSVFRDLTDHHARVLAQKQRLVQIYDLHLKLQVARAKAQSPDSVDNQNKGNNDIANTLRNFSPVQEWWFPENLTLDWLVDSAWGQQVMHSTLSWLRECTWNLNPKLPDNLEPGISWSEVAVAIALKHGMWLPVKRKDPQGVERVVQPVFQGSQLTIATDLAEQTQVAHAIITHLKALVPEAILPDCKNGKVRSLLYLGFHAWSTGLKLKPAYPSQGQVFDLLSTHFIGNNTWLGGLPAIPFNSGFQTWECDITASRIPWTKRAQKANFKMKAVRKERGN